MKIIVMEKIPQGHRCPALCGFVHPVGPMRGIGPEWGAGRSGKKEAT